MPTYIQLLKWTDQGRKNATTIVERVEEVSKRAEQELGIRVIGSYLTMGRFDQVIVSEAPNDEAVAKIALIVAGRGNVTTETFRAFTMEEAAKLV
jgi:uncharacterized protein with GYD domain